MKEPLTPDVEEWAEFCVLFVEWIEMMSLGLESTNRAGAGDLLSAYKAGYFNHKRLAVAGKTTTYPATTTTFGDTVTSNPPENT